MQANLMMMTDAVVLRGQRAWGKIKTTAAEQRQLWREIGEALLVGRRLHKADQKFSQWCRENGFDMGAPVRSDAIWLAEKWDEAYNDCKPEMAHPTAIRTYVRNLTKTKPPSPAVDLSDLPKPSMPAIDRQSAKKINKLAAMAERGEGQERKTAERYLKAQASRLGVDEREMVSLSKKLDPALSVPANRLPVLEQTVEILKQQLTILADFIRQTQEGDGTTPISKEFVIALFNETCADLNLQ